MRADFACSSKDEREAVNKAERVLGLISDQELFQLAMDFITCAKTAKEEGHEIAMVDAGGHVVCFVEQNKENPAKLKLAYPKGPKGP